MLLTRKIWKDSVGQEFFADFDTSLAGLIAYKMYLLKPDGTEVEKTNVTIVGTKLKWLSQAGDFSQIGEYSLQPWINDGTFTGRREPLQFYVLDNQAPEIAEVIPSDVREYLEGYGIETDIISNDWIEKRLARFIVPYVESVTRQTFSGISSITEYYSGAGQNYLILNRRPIVAVQSIQYVLGGNYFTVVNMGNIETISALGILKAKSNYEEAYYMPIFARGNFNLKITYTYGYLTFPDDIKEACIMLSAEQVLGFIGSRTGGGDISGQAYSRNFGDRGKYTEIRNDLARQAYGILRKYMTRVAGA